MYRLSVFLVCFVLSCGTASGARLDDRWTVMFRERFRLVTWDNAISLDESAAATRTFTRHRTQLGVEFAPNSTLSFGARLANEFRYYTAPTSIDFHFDEIFVDNLWLRVTRPWQQPFILTLGRQDLMLGEGFVVMDGNPLDGSRGAYFNAVRLDWQPASGKQLTLFACHQEETDDWLPIVHSKDQQLVEQAETGYGAYFAGHFGRRELHAYLLYKRRGANEDFPLRATAVTLGSRFSTWLTSSDRLSAVVEAAVQSGEVGDADRRAYGGYGYLLCKPNWGAPCFFLPQQVSVGAVCVSGDDPESERFEGWDPMFARWPKWSESYIYTQIREGGVAWWSNLVSLTAMTRFVLSPKVDLRLDYHHLMALETPPGAGGFPGGAGTDRGDLFIGRLIFSLDNRWTGHLLWEGFNPGSYYFDGADSYAWIRAELMYQY